jgi:hypothetical protein
MPNNFNWGDFGDDLGGIFSSIFNQSNYKNPASAAQPYLNQIPGELQQYLNPYINSGQNAMGILQGQYGNLLQNPSQTYNQLSNNSGQALNTSNQIQGNWQQPTNVMNQIGSTYQSSPGYQWNVQQATNAGNNAAAAGGMLGSPQQQQNMASTVSGLANQDYNNYVDTGLNQYNRSVSNNLGQYNNFMNQGMNMYNTGLSGFGNINQMGYGASNNMSQDLASALMSQANLAYSGQQNQNENQGGSMGGLFGNLGDLFHLKW